MEGKGKESQINIDMVGDIGCHAPWLMTPSVHTLNWRVLLVWGSFVGGVGFVGLKDNFAISPSMDLTLSALCGYPPK